MKLYIVYLMLLIFLIPSVIGIGTTRYPTAGGVDQDYSNEGRGSFLDILPADGIFDFDQFSKGLSGSEATPIIDDFDNNSISEMIIMDEDTVRAYQNKELDIIGAVFDIGDNPADVSNILSFDIDGDGFNEIIFLALNVNSSNDVLFILNFTQSDGIQLEKRFTVLTDVTHPMIGCRASNECIMTVTSRSTVDAVNPFTAFHNAFSFDSTGLTSGETTIFSESQPSSDAIALCSPRDKKVVVDDFDGDGNLEYIISMGLKEDSGGATAEWHIFWLDNLTVELTGFEPENVPELVTGGCTGTNSLTNSFTSPISAELFSGEANKESCIGAQSSDDDFRIFCLSGSDGSTVDEYPEELSLLEADGNIISNIVLGNFIPDSPNDQDVCVMGFDSVDNEYELLCGSDKRTGVIFSHRVYGFPFEELGFNISFDVKEQHHLIHGVQFSNELTESVDLEEILSTYGIFKIDFTPANLVRIFDPQTTRGVNLAIDLEKFGQDDIISMTETNIFYFDDRGKNNPAVIVDIEYIPCPVDTLIQINTTMQVKVTARDTNTIALGFDNINFDTSAYFGDGNQQNRSLPDISTNPISGEAVVIYTPRFEMNKTITNGIIRTQIQDTNLTEADVEEQLFSVAQQGLTFEDGVSCIVEVELIAAAEVEEPLLNITADALANEGIIGFVEGGSNQFKVSPLVFVLILMLAYTIAVFTTKDKTNDSMITMNKVIFMIVGNAFIFIIGTIIGAISFGIMLVIIILAIFSVVLWARRQFTGNQM
ncbi:hypothetical protein LCGC14_0636220 [marine sediment metagenome]|uniref:Uncharacterized protein n=1 Tax=marine sediment metagenome TaxID=412755 RepID=A0A0F9R5V1_9ZZZZ